MIEQELRDLYWENARMIDWIALLVSFVRQQNIQRLNRELRVAAKSLQQNLSGVLSQMKLFAEYGLTWGEDYLLSILSGLEQAQIQQDYILIGDLY